MYASTIKAVACKKCFYINTEEGRVLVPFRSVCSIKKENSSTVSVHNFCGKIYEGWSSNVDNIIDIFEAYLTEE